MENTSGNDHTDMASLWYEFLRVVEWVAMIRFLFGMCHY